MRPWLSRSLIVAAAFAACWLGAVWYWRATRRMPGTDDLVIYLLLLPLLLVLLVWGASKLVAAAGAASAASAASATAPAAQTPSAAPPAAALAVLAGALRMPHGDGTAQLADALLSRKANLALDPDLLNDSGYPILSGRVDDVDIAAQQDTMDEWLRAHHADTHFSGEQWRALALGSDVATELAAQLDGHPALAPYTDAVRAGKPPPPLPMLHVVALLPADWADAERTAAIGWLRHVVARYGWPAARLAPPLLAVHAQAALPLIGQLANQARQEEQPLLCLVLACGSHIGEASVEAWAGQGMLFDSDHPQGRIPGEGAAGLLLADAAQGALFADQDLPLMYPASSALRAASADTKQRGDVGLLAELAKQALATAGVDAANIAMLTADSDQRASRMTELLAMVSATLPELDPGEQLLTVAAACGDAGAVSTVAALVLAQQQVRDGAGPALCVTNLDPFHRGAVLLAAPAGTAAPPKTATA
ncbi:hypothetical protein SAMN05428959_1015 [Duganella sp. CF517]|uniref:hypothetical protein n=1 Tax=Duganella sp. CF517 TaxID=1881038 RepID=UPI0008C34DD0|nr:hypothetical protein [Duganella sp. CF517]SEN05921.1 hypothetical protein SAMN05428959_1015 [Duganella sp. CF517]